MTAAVGGADGWELVVAPPPERRGPGLFTPALTVFGLAHLFGCGGEE